MSLDIRPVTLREANAFVIVMHRHSGPVTGCRFALGAFEADRLAGVGIAGRPSARLLDDGLTLEILRVATDGTPNACSMLYGRLARVARLMGYARLITYTLASEEGASLRAVGARQVAEVKAQEWSRPSRPRGQCRPALARIRWEL